MLHFPSLCVDDFYSNPDKIREFALAQEFTHTDKGKWPGKRTKRLHLIDPDFFDKFCKKLFSLYYDLDTTDVSWVVSTYFQLIPAFSNDINSNKNTGWVHFDGRTVFAGVVYLNPTIDPRCGTSIHRLIDESKHDRDHLMKIKQDFYKNNIDQDYDKALIENNNSFIETARYNNVYNRLITFDGTVPHQANSYYSAGEDRLTQVFFVEEVNASCKTPIVRHQQFL